MSIEMVWSSIHDESFDVRQFACALLEGAKENLKKDGYVQSAAFLVTNSEIRCYSVSFSGYDEKEATYCDVVEKARELNAEAIITLNDAFVGDKLDSSEYEWGQIAKSPRGECLFVTVSGPKLENWTKEVQYRREASGFIFSPPSEALCSFIGMLGNWARKGQRVN